jgi:nucleotide-binding universal stress UspA family protein
MKILIATDGSEFSRLAVEKAGDVAGGMPQVEIRVISAYELPGPVAAGPFVAVPAYTQEIIDGLTALAEKIVADARETIAKNLPSAKVSTKTVCGRPAPAILDEAEEWGADVIVVGSHGNGFWTRALLGSVSDAVVHHAKCSVLVVRKAQVETL